MLFNDHWNISSSSIVQVAKYLTHSDYDIILIGAHRMVSWLVVHIRWTTNIVHFILIKSDVRMVSCSSTRSPNIILIELQDWARDSGLSGHIKFHHGFQICCILTNDLRKTLKWNFTVNEQFNWQDLQLTEIKCCSQNSRYLQYCGMVYFVPTWSLFTGPVTNINL